MTALNPTDQTTPVPVETPFSYIQCAKDCTTQALGHTWRVIRITLDGVGRVFIKTEGVDKAAKGAAGVLLLIQVYFNDLNGKVVPIVVAANTRLRQFSDTLAGLVNLPGRVYDFAVNRDAKGNLILLQKSWLKISSRAVLVCANLGETLIMLKTFGVELAGAAATIGNSRIVQGTITILNVATLGQFQRVVTFIAENKLEVVKNKFVFFAALLSCIDAFDSIESILCCGGRGDLLSPLLTVGNELGKAYIVTYCVGLGFFTYSFAAAVIFTNICAISKILIEDYQKNPLILDEPKKAAAAAA